jgi:hypothetical protein
LVLFEGDPVELDVFFVDVLVKLFRDLLVEVFRLDESHPAVKREPASVLGFDADPDVLNKKPVTKQILPIGPVVFIVGHHGFEEILNLISDNKPIKGLVIIVDLELEVVLLAEVVFEGVLVVEHPVVDSAEGVDVAFGSVVLLETDLGGFGALSAYGLVHELSCVVQGFGESKISYFKHTVINENIARLEIPMTDEIVL